MTYLLKLFRQHRSRFVAYQRRLHQAGVLTTYDQYLARAVRHAAVATLLGLLVAAALFWLVGPLTATVAGTFALLAGGCVLAGWYLYPTLRRGRRRREIDQLLPYAVVSMYVLAQAGLSSVAIIERLARADVYGELAKEFETIRRDVTYYGEDMLTALESAEERAPSQRLSTFLADLQTVIQSQTSFGEFVERQNHRQFEEFEERQAAFVERLKTFAQVYILVTFVAPLLVLVFLVVLSFGANDTLVFTYVIAYVYPVVAIAGTLLILDRLGRQVSLPHSRPPGESEDAPDPPDEADAVLKTYRRARWRRTLREWQPLVTFRRRPAVTLAVTVPAALLVVGVVSYAAASTPWAFYRHSPILATSAAVGLAVIALLPLVWFHGQRRARQRAVLRRIPEHCESLAEATHIGRTPIQSCRVVGEEGTGPLAAAMRDAAREAQLTGDLEPALWSVADRLQVPELTLTISTIVEALSVTTDLEAPLSILADAAEDRAELARNRRRTMELYGVVVAFGLLVFLMVVSFLTLVFFPQLANVTTIEGTAFRAPDIDAETYKVILFHASLVQAGGNGLVIGKLRDGDALSGIKYSVAFLVFVTVAFLGLGTL